MSDEWTVLAIDPSAVTPPTLAERQHVRHESTGDHGTWVVCITCHVDWPCHGAVRELEAEIDRLRTAIGEALTELDAEHGPDETVKGRWCMVCGAADGSWPCVSKMVADDLRRALDSKAET